MPNNTLSVAQIIADYGAYYENAGQNKARLLNGLMQPSVTLQIPGIRHIKTNDTIYRLANPIFAKVLQGFQKQFTPNGNLDFHPNEIRQCHVKVDFEVEPHDIEATWLGFLAGDSSKNIEDWGICRYILEEYISKQVEDDKETDAIYKGVYSAPTPGTANTPSDTMDGLKVQLINGAADSQYPIHVVNSLGTYDPDDAFDYIEAFCNEISPLHKSRLNGLTIFCAEDIVTDYLRVKRNRGFYNISTDTELSTRIDFTKINLRGIPSMNGTTDIFATVTPNILHLNKRDFNAASIDVQKVDRVVKFLIDWWEAVGFGCNDLVWATEETVTESAASDDDDNN